VTDARFPERWLNDRRVLRLSAEGFRLFVISMAWSVSNRTDGVVDEDDITMMPKVHHGQVDELVKAGLWRPSKDSWVIVDFASTQTGAHELEVLENVRRREREKKVRQRASKGDSPPGTSPGTVPRDSTGEERLGEARQGNEVGEVQQAEDWPEVAVPGHIADWAMDLYDAEAR
jgi:hypothetical protein